jgi:hypothetical protein
MELPRSERSLSLRRRKETERPGRTLLEALERMPEGARVVVDGSASDFIDHDIVEALGHFRGTASRRNIQLEVRDVGRTPVMAL